MKRYSIILICIALIFIGCNSKQVSQPEGELVFVQADTIILESIPFSFQYKFVKLQPNGQEITLTQVGRLWSFDVDSGELTFHVDFDETDIVLPDHSIHSALIDDHHIMLFYPAIRKVVMIDQNLELVDEIRVEDLPHNHKLDFYGDYFHKTKSGWTVGLAYNIFEAYTEEYYANARRAAIIDFSGQYKKSFLRLAEEDRKAKKRFLSFGAFAMDVVDNIILAKNAVGTSKFEYFDSEGNLLREVQAAHSLIDYSIENSNSTGLDLDGAILDSTIDLKIIDESSFAFLNESLTPDDEGRSLLKIVMAVYSGDRNKVYATKLKGSQRLFKATRTHLYFLTVHPTLDELCIIKVAYQLVD